MLRLRSCASSMMIESYCRRSGSRLRLGEQDSVGHQLQPATRADLVVEAHLVADERPELRLQLLRDPRRDRARSDPARLRVADPAVAAAADLEQHFRQLRRLAGAGLAADDNDRVRCNRPQDVVLPCVDRQRRVEPGRDGVFHSCRVSPESRPGRLIGPAFATLRVSSCFGSAAMRRRDPGFHAGGNDDRSRDHRDPRRGRAARLPGLFDAREDGRTWSLR
jgi:hypothetical protein